MLGEWSEDGLELGVEGHFLDCVIMGNSSLTLAMLTSSETVWKECFRNEGNPSVWLCLGVSPGHPDVLSERLDH